jgi:glycosidase
LRQGGKLIRERKANREVSNVVFADGSANAAGKQGVAPVSSAWPRFPVLYEINTWVWLSDLSRKYGRQIDLAAVPAGEWDAIAEFGFDAVWFMGVWQRSAASIAVSSQNTSLQADFHRALPDYRPEDNVGSAYSVRNYEVDEHLGGRAGLAKARQELAARGMKLVLDFVPNHVAPDHPWAAQHPEYFVRGDVHDYAHDPASYEEVAGNVFACGRDPYFPAWQDVLQLNACQPALRQAAIETVTGIAQQCDGVRCDMAMLLLNSVFARTWGNRAGQPPPSDYWVEVISAVKSSHPFFIFMAEAYWDLEWELQQKGFDFCYDKKLYDRLAHENAEAVRLHLLADPAYQDKLVRFIENHDEPRAAATFPPAKEHTLAVTLATLPGMRLFHEGQFEGRKLRVPVFLARRAEEPVDHELQESYRKLLRATRHNAFRQGDWALCERSGWPDNASYQNLVAWTWTAQDAQFLIVVNLSDTQAQGLIKFDCRAAGAPTCRLVEVLSGIMYDRNTAEMATPGLYVNLGPWSYHFFKCS